LYGKFKKAQAAQNFEINKKELIDYEEPDLEEVVLKQSKYEKNNC
jgi:hypothetical protein